MPQLPTGTVSFVFTDIEGSTVLWEKHRDHMQADLERHDELLRSAIESNAGYVFKTVGDAFCAAFWTASDAVQATIDGQLSLRAEQWRVPGGIRVRMALHVGAAVERNGDYFGPTINRVARLNGAGHGGQGLLSAAAAELVRESLPDLAALRSLGSHRLKDLSQQQVFELVYGESPAEFPSLVTLDSRPNNLPRQLTPFIGRDVVFMEVTRLLERETVALVTLTGPGGTGKTRLALQVAAGISGLFKHGVFFVDLAPIRQPRSALYP